MISFIAPFLVSLLVTVLTTPLAVLFANKFKLVDDPKKRPHPAHVQNRAVPRAGGLPIFLGILVAVLLFIPTDKYIIGILLSISLLLAVGLIDDFLTNFSPYPRLILQFFAAAIVVASGVGITFITNPLGGILMLDQFVIPINFLGLHNIIVIADLLAFLWIVWVMNMINWSKGVDGQMPGIIFVAALVIGWVSYQAFLKGDPHQLYIGYLGFITAGASLGFLFFNWYPAKIFPGFSGSTILGFMIATLCILTSAKLATALLVLLIPSIDSIYTIARRIASGKSPFRGDRQHLHHLLLERGWSHQKISLFYISSCAILGLVAVNLSSEGKLFTVIGVGIIILGFLLWLHFFGHYLGRQDPDNG
ncbi:undecaprenyl/decaprenyl-phosphate alpha-N-acetylglucosaminyl 1-phosphate transferase [Candidatus Daviesbacteria bacterium]|nr:undecaprenyl/decaprenyl-phosphate alpha-N-acetylglucosaminyl 1-phosphate transferase [Candidatus Daviesbacteria bacterium]